MFMWKGVTEAVVTKWQFETDSYFIMYYLAHHYLEPVEIGMVVLWMDHEKTELGEAC